ncbi:MAG: hypothetical protein WCI31_12240 [Prolixibacteraceae bacterium]
MRQKIFYLFLFASLFSHVSFATTAVQMKESDRFRVEIRAKGQTKWKKLIAYQSINPNQKSQDISWSSFAAPKPMEIRIRSVQQNVDSVRIRPGAFKINYELRDNFILVNINKPLKISIEINGDKNHPLLLFAEPSEIVPSTAKAGKVIIFKAGVHQIGERYPLVSNTTYYLQEGAILMGSMYGKGTVENVTIQGRGILNSGHQLWQHPTKGLLSNISFEDGRNIRIEGITCIEAGNFQLKIQSKGENTQILIENVKLIGWNNNTDGIHVSDMDWKDHPIVGNGAGTRLTVLDCFIRANDDAVLLNDGVAYSEMKNCVIWDDGGGATFCMSWGGHNRVDSCLVSHCYVIHKEGKNPVFRANHAGEAILQNLRFEDITIEGDAPTLIGLKIFQHRYDPDPGMGAIRNVSFKNITLEGANTENFIEGFNQEHMIENITFDSLRINGKLIQKAEEMNLKMNAFVRNVNFTKH